ncbi:MAG: methyltransferase domain-containing protein [Betaproteobacteria bacterium]|nr:methyltransferase domain-containing protein [Betaproteobacteria bacterium]
MKMQCNVCGSENLAFLQLDAIPPIQNHFCANAAQIKDFPLTNVDFLWCSDCHHISIRKGKHVDFDANYNNEQSSSGIALGHFGRIVADIQSIIPNKAARIIEIGCGRGDLLKLLIENGYSNVQGFDPVAEGSIFISKGYWTGSESADVELLILRHTLEEIPGLDDFMQKVSASLASEGRVYCEFTNASRIISEKDAFSIYPECSNIFSISSLSSLLARHGLVVEKTHSYFNGEWLGLWGKKLNAINKGSNWGTQLDAIAQKIRELPRPVVLWGAGGRGGNVLSFCQLDSAVISHVVDLNPAKQGMFIPPFGQKVISPQELLNIAPKTVLISSNKYRSEILPHLPDGCNVLSLGEL